MQILLTPELVGDDLPIPLVPDQGGIGGGQVILPKGTIPAGWTVLISPSNATVSQNEAECGREVKTASLTFDITILDNQNQVRKISDLKNGIVIQLQISTESVQGNKV